MRKILTWLPIAVLLILMCSVVAHAGKWSDYPDVGSSTLNFNAASTDSLLALDADSAGAQIYQYMLDDLITDLVASVLLANDEIDASSELLAIMDDETGTGKLCFATSPTFITPTLGVAAATTLNTGPGAYELYAMDQDVESDDDVIFNSVTTAAASAAKVSFKDEDAPGADKDVGNIQVDYIDSDNGDGAENADMIFRITQSGSEDTEILRFDESDDRWESAKAALFLTLDTGQGAYELFAMDQDVEAADTVQFAAVELSHGSDNSLTASSGVLSIESVPLAPAGISTVTDVNGFTMSAAQCLAGVVAYATGAGTIVMCPVLATSSFTVIDYGGAAVVLDPDGTGQEDRIILDGLLLGIGDGVTSTSTTGDIIVCTYQAADVWYCASGSPDGDHWTDTN